MSNPAGTVSSRSSRIHMDGSASRPFRDVTKFARLFFYALTAPAFAYGIYVQMVILKHPDRVQSPASQGFGKDTVFLTFHGNVLCAIYAFMCLLHTSLAVRPRWRRKRSIVRTKSKNHDRGLVGVLERATHRYSGPLFSLGFFVGAAYYLLIHFHPATRLRALMVEDFDQHMALLHLLPWSFVVGDALLKNHESWRKHSMGARVDGRYITFYGGGYAVWSYFCVYMNGGDWPYPFQRNFNVLQHFMFVGTVLVVSASLTKIGNRIMGTFDRANRLRWETRNATSQIS